MYIYYEIEKKLYHNYYPFAAAPFPATINERDINDTCCNDIIHIHRDGPSM